MSRSSWKTLAAAELLDGQCSRAGPPCVLLGVRCHRPVTLQGPVTRVEWINPHAWIHLQVKSAAGQVETWMVEGGTPNTLQRRGITRDSLKIGTVIVVAGYKSKDGSKRANGRDITLPDGRTLFMGSSGTGAPRDGRDPNEPKKKGSER